MSSSPAIVWFRTDLRLSDNPALAAAVDSEEPVLPVYIADEEGEGKWKNGAASKWWLHHSLKALDAELRGLGSRLVLRSGRADRELAKLIEQTGAKSVYWNRRYEPAIIKRDTDLKKKLAKEGILARSFNGSLLHSPLKIANKSGSPFKVFTPFWNHIRKLDTRKLFPCPTALKEPTSWPSGASVDSLALLPKLDWDEGFYERWEPGEAGARSAFDRFANHGARRYEAERDLPAGDGVSRLSPHLHFGEISPVEIWRRLGSGEYDPYLRQIAWREFAHHLLYHFNETPETALKPEFVRFPWERKSKLLNAWQKGMTGFPIVDAGMRELWRTGWMHNRVRMIAASFLVKQLLQPWQEGAKWFWNTLVDADLANNTLGWQWVAGCGADAAPFFRIFNPITQGERFDGDGEYTRKWVPELAKLPDEYLFKPWEAPESVLEAAEVSLGRSYPRPIVSHEEGRKSALAAYQSMKEAG